MSIGTAVFLIMVGAILKYAVTISIADVSLSKVGLILMIAGVVGAVASVITTRMGNAHSASAPPRSAA